MAMRLNQAALNCLPAAVSVPQYNRTDVTAGILHIGVGNFHRAHQAVYLDRLFNRGRDHDWGIIGAGIKSFDATMRKRLAAQDWLSTVIELDPQGYTARVIGPMIDFAEVDPQRLVEILSRPEIRIVSLTITEGGYYIDATDGGFNADHPEIIRDLENPEEQQTVFGLLISALGNRHDQGMPPFTIMSCDNLPENGAVTKRAMVGLAKLMAPGIAGWIEDMVAFPNGMVDCITPATGDRERAMAEEKFGIADPGVVVCEPFRQWVLEDSFPQGRPALEEVGVEFVGDVAPYELMKLRILNGGHAIIAYPAALMGLEFARDAMATPVIRAFLEKLETEEVLPTIPPIPGVDFQAYLEQTMSRFANPEIGDTIARLCLDGSNRQPKFILPAIADRLAADLPIDGLAMEVALWCRYCAGTRDDGHSIKLEDEKAERLRQAALQAKSEPTAFLAMDEVFGPTVSNPAFRKAFSTALTALWEHGTKGAMEAFVGRANR